MELAKNALAKAMDEREKIEVIEIRGVPIRMSRCVQEPAGHLTREDFPTGSTIEWTFWHTEVHIVLGGKAEIEYFMPPLHTVRGKAVAEAGDAYLIYQGERMVWKVVSKEPFMRLCIVMPAVPIPTGEQLVAEHYYEHQGRKK